MVQRLNSFLVVLLLIFQGEVFAQENTGPEYTGIDPKKVEKSVIFRDCWTMSARQLNIKPGNQVEFIKLPICYETLKNFDPIAIGFEKQLQSNAPTKDPVTKISSFILFKQAIPSSFYKDQLGFFCKKELQLDKITVMPVRFRLGSLDYVNYLEQKPNAIKIQ